MFVSVSKLCYEIGLDEEIARYFVDRKVPANNSFWEKRFVYIGRANGYISIPVYYDLLYKIGISKEILLAEDHVQFMEQLMHYAILHEKQEISSFQQLERMNELLAGRIRDQAFFEELISYLTQSVLLPIGRLGTPNPSLNRADAFLFVLCDLPLSENQLTLAIKYWYALHPCYLIFDDIHDYQKDKSDGEENVIMEWGDGQKGLERAIAVLEENARILENLNQKLSESIALHIEELREQSIKLE
ncbi:MAG: hypothetical protein ACHQET_11360 [Chitinophagales bacterium]